MSAFALDDVDPLSSLEDREVVDDLNAVGIGVGQSRTARAAEFHGLNAAVGAVEGQPVALIGRGEVGGVVQQHAVPVLDVGDEGIEDVDLGIEHAHIGPVGGEELLGALEGVDMVVLGEDGGVPGGPAGLVGALHLFGALVAVASVLLGGIEDAVGAVVVQRAEGVDVFRNAVHPPVHQIEVVAGLVDGKTAGVLAHPVPAMEIA